MNRSAGLLNWRELWHRSPAKEDQRWVHVQLAGRGDCLECMLASREPDRQQLGTIHDVCLQVSDVEATHANLRQRGLPERQRLRRRIGRNRRRLLDLFDPDGSRIQLMGSSLAIPTGGGKVRSMKVTRRGFLASSGFAVQAASGQPARKFSANDHIQFALIGAGGMGMGDARMALQVGGTRLVAVADVYQGRLERARELWGKGIQITRDYREILARPDVDAVIIATPDHWHARQTIDALEAGKDVYCEKPMVQKLEQGRAVIEAEKRTGRILQVGSQYVTSLIYQKAGELLRSGAIGELNMVEAWLDRNSALGAWQYTIPPDASPENIDWDRFLGDAPRRPFEPIRLFRWRNYRDYGTGIGGDLFVHLFSGLHLVTGALGPSRVFATGGLRYWKDGRDVPDVMLALLDYPGFNVALRVNFKASVADEQFGFRFVGSEGILQTGPAVVLYRPPRETEPGLTISTFPRALQERILAEYRKKYPALPPSTERMRDQGETRFAPPPGYDAHVEHHRVFWTAVRERKPVLEDGTFGFRAAGPALLANKSYFENCICRWDPVTMTELS